MATCVPIKDLRDTAAFSEFVKAAPEPVTVTKNGYDEFVCVRSEDFRRMEQAEARASLMARMAIAEHERAAGEGIDAFADIAAARAAYGL